VTTGNPEILLANSTIIDTGNDVLKTDLLVTGPLVQAQRTATPAPNTTSVLNTSASAATALSAKDLKGTEFTPL
jgi:hypothetical protein